MKKTRKRSTYAIYYNVTTREICDFRNWSRRQIRKRLVQWGKPRDWKDVTNEYARLYLSCEVTEPKTVRR